MNYIYIHIFYCRFDKEGVMFIRERQEGFFRRNESKTDENKTMLSCITIFVCCPSYKKHMILYLSVAFVLFSLFFFDHLSFKNTVQGFTFTAVHFSTFVSPDKKNEKINIKAVP